MIYLLMLSLVLLTPITLVQAQFWGHLTSNSGPVAYAHIRIAPENLIVVSNREGWFEIPAKTKVQSLTISCIGYLDTIIKVDTNALKASFEVVLRTHIHDLPELTILRKQLTAKEILKKARNVAKTSEIPDTMVVIGRAGEYSQDNGKFVHAVEGEFIRLGPASIMSATTKITALYKCRLIARDHKYNTAGMDFLWVAQQGTPSRVIRSQHLKQKIKVSNVVMGGDLHYYIECVNKDSTELTTFIIRQDNFTIVSANFIWPKPSERRSKIPGGDAYQQIQFSEYRFEYTTSNNYILLANARFEHKIHYFKNSSLPTDLEHNRYIIVENFKTQSFASWKLTNGKEMKGLRTLNELDMHSSSWEDRAENSELPIIKTILSDITSFPEN